MYIWIFLGRLHNFFLIWYPFINRANMWPCTWFQYDKTFEFNEWDETKTLMQCPDTMVYACEISCESFRNNAVRKQFFMRPRHFFIVQSWDWLVSLHLIMPMFTYFLLLFVSGGFCHNFVIFVADELGRSDVSWNNDKVKTPNLDLLAKDGLLL